MKTLLNVIIGLLLFSPAGWAGDFEISSPVFENNTAVPQKYTCDGANISPPLTFKNIPANAKSLALTVSDPDAPSGTWTHWVIYNIAPDTTQLTENSNPGTRGLNDFEKYAYGGPCPPGGRLHHYIFHAYALDTMLDISGIPTRGTIEKAVEGHIIAEAQLTGTYQK